MSRARATVAVLVLCATSAWAGKAPRVKVAFVSTKRAYLDAGRKQGLTMGQTLQLQRNGRTVASCKIDQLADREAACLTSDARVGDMIALAGEARPPAPPPPPALPPPPTTADLQNAAAALAEAPVDKVDFKGATGGLSRSGATLFSASVGHEAFIEFGGSNFEQERIDLQLNGLDIRWAGFRAYAHVTALFTTLSPDTQRFRKGDVAQVYVWELALSSRQVGRSWTLSVGRIWPHHTPGLGMLDGLQAGWRSKNGTAEVGVYGGLVPNAMTLYPQVQPWSTGVYYGHTLVRGKRSVLRLLQTEGRLGVRGGGPGPQLELEWALLAAFSRYVDLGTQARFSLGAGDWSTPSFDAARVSLGIRPYERLHINASFRYLGNAVPDYDDFAAGLFGVQRVYHGALDLVWEPKPWMAIALMSGADHESDSGNGREYFGPELSFPTIFRQRGGVSIGYREELGWYAGQQLYVTLHGEVDQRFRVLARLSYFEERPTGNFTDPAMRELGIYAFGDLRIVRWLALRASVMARLGIDGYFGTTPAGLNARLELFGSL